jgi:glutamate-ammonia-ligase adenylyltransferase
VAGPPPEAVEAIRAALASDPVPWDPKLLDAFVAGLDPLYFAREAPADVAAHVRMAAALGPSRPARVRVTPREGGRSDVTVVARDYFGEFSLLCGLLAVHRLGIESGHVHTFVGPAVEPAMEPVPPRSRAGRVRPRRRPAPAGARTIVDVFRVRPAPGAAEPDAAALEKDLLELLALCEAGRADDARQALNRRLVESLAASWDSARPGGEALAPLEITLGGEDSSSWTVMDVRGRDTPGFLYALANALAMRAIYVHEVRIESVGGEARDRFWIAHRDGGKIEAAADRQALRLAVALIKQFTHLLPWAPDPARALRYFDQLLDEAMAGAPSALATLTRPEGLRELARLLGSSEFLWEDFLRLQLEHLAPVLGGWRSRELPSGGAWRRELRARVAAGASPDDRKRLLNDFKDEQLLIVDMKHLLDPALTLEGFSRALGELAEAVVEEALALARAGLEEKHGWPRLPSGGESPVAIFGLGKFGGGEMGYASDLEMLVVYDGPDARTDRTGIPSGVFFDELVRALVGVIDAREEGIFHVDLRLRPFGGGGALASPLEAIRDYYRPDGGAAPFERQALIKLRPVAGDAGLGRAVMAQRDAFVWSGLPWDRADALHLRDRQARELVPSGRFNVKYSPGGLIEVEYAAQYLQIQHGRAHPELRTPSTQEALDGLRAKGILSEAEHRRLDEAYVFWRRAADGLRMVRGNARDLLLPPEGSEELRSLARRLEYPGTGATAAELLGADVRGHRDRVHSFFLARFG